MKAICPDNLPGQNQDKIAQTAGPPKNRLMLPYWRWFSVARFSGNVCLETLPDFVAVFGSDSWFGFGSEIGFGLVGSKIGLVDGSSKSEILALWTEMGLVLVVTSCWLTIGLSDFVPRLTPPLKVNNGMLPLSLSVLLAAGKRTSRWLEDWMTLSSCTPEPKSKPESSPAPGIGWLSVDSQWRGQAESNITGTQVLAVANQSRILGVVCLGASQNAACGLGQSVRNGEGVGVGNILIELGPAGDDDESA